MSINRLENVSQIFNGMGEYFRFLEGNVHLLPQSYTFTSACEMGRERSVAFNTRLIRTSLDVVNFSFENVPSDLHREVENLFYNANMNANGMAMPVLLALLADANLTKAGLCIPGYEKPINRLVIFSNLGSENPNLIYQMLSRLLPEGADLSSYNFFIDEVVGDTGSRFDALENFVVKHSK